MKEKRRKFFTTTQMAEIVGVSKTTIINWINAGRIPSFSTDGGHRRVTEEDLVGFLLANNMTVPAEIAGEKKRIAPRIVRKRSEAQVPKPTFVNQDLPDLSTDIGRDVAVSVQRAAQILGLTCNDVYELHEHDLLPGKRLDNGALVFRMADVFRAGLRLHE